MTVILLEEEELRLRIIEHLQARPGNPFAGAVWQGYLAGLLEWGLIDPNAHARLSDLLPEAGSAEMVEIMLGPEYVDAHPELLKSIRTAAE